MPKPWKRFKLRCRHIDKDGMQQEKNVVVKARSIKEAINRWLWKTCANDVAKRNRYHLWDPSEKLQMYLNLGAPLTKEEAEWEKEGLPEKNYKRSH